MTRRWQIVLTTTAPSSTYHVACRRTLSSSLLLLYWIRKRSPSPSRPSSRLSNCLSRSDSSLFNALPSLEALVSPPGGIYNSYQSPRCPLEAILARQRALGGLVNRGN